MKEFNESDALVHAVGLVRELHTKLAEVTRERERLREALVKCRDWSSKSCDLVTCASGSWELNVYQESLKALHEAAQPEPNPFVMNSDHAWLREKEASESACESVAVGGSIVAENTPVPEPKPEALTCGACMGRGGCAKCRMPLHEIPGVPRMPRTEAPKCGECGGDGYYKGPRLGDEPCPKYNGTGRAQ